MKYVHIYALKSVVNSENSNSNKFLCIIKTKNTKEKQQYLDALLVVSLFVL